jgi:transposase
MRGQPQEQGKMFSYVSLEERVRADHPLRAIRRMTDQALKELSKEFDELYSRTGRPSIPPEKLLRALLVQMLYSVRSERLLMEEIEHNLLYRWFVGLDLDEAVWVATVFSKNRERLLEGDIASKFFRSVLGQAGAKGLMSEEHFSVDSTLIEAWAGEKSYRPKAQPPAQGSGSRGEMLLNDTHESTTDPDARMFRKSQKSAFRLVHHAHVLSENRNGLIVATKVTAANPKAEREAAVELLKHGGGKGKRRTVGGDKNFDERGFVKQVRRLGVTPHVAQYGGQRSSAIDRRTTRHSGYTVSQKKRKRIEQIFGWIKTVARLDRTRHRGRRLVEWMFGLAAAAYNLVRMRNLERLTG